MHLLVNQPVLKGLTLFAYLVLFSFNALAYDSNVVTKQYIRILELELFERYDKAFLIKTVPKPRAKPQYHRLPREKPAHPLTTYRDLYVYVVHPWDFDKQRTIKCYSVGTDKYGFIIKIPCKEKE
jgi:hypothetical protein